MNDKAKAYSCKIFTVWEEKVRMANGHESLQSWVEHQPTVAVMALTAQSELLLIRQYRTPVGDLLLEIPAGSMDPGETALSCAGRELAEETGFAAGRLTEVYSGYLLPGYCNEFMHFFVAQDLIHAPLKPDDDEVIEVIPTPIADVLIKIQNGEIRDAKTALGVLLLERYLNNNTNFSNTSLLK